MASYEKRTWWTRHGLTERLAREELLEAAITGAFVIAAADGSASEQEYDALLDRLEILGGIERDKVDAILTVATNELEASGFEPRLARVGELVTERADAMAVMMLALAIALADDDVSAQEREVATQLATALRIADVNLDELVTEIRG